jgi:hypothetical protein
MAVVLPVVIIPPVTDTVKGGFVRAHTGIGIEIVNEVYQTNRRKLQYRSVVIAKARNREPFRPNLLTSVDRDSGIIFSTAGATPIPL